MCLRVVVGMAQAVALVDEDILELGPSLSAATAALSVVLRP